MKSFTKYLREDDSSDPTNFALKKKMREGVDFVMLPKECWDILKGRFNGLELVRFKNPDTYSRSFMIHFA